MNKKKNNLSRLCRMALPWMFFLFIASMAQSVYYSENFEGTVSMTDSGGGWQYGTPSVVGPTTVPEGTKCAGTILNGNYIDYANYKMYTPVVTLPNVDSIRLSFVDWYQLESCCDSVVLEVSQNGSNVWTKLFGTRNTNTSWTQEQYSLSAYRNSTIQLRFRLTSDYSNVYPGWYIDNIKIYHPVQCTLTVNTSAGGTTAPSGLALVDSGIQKSIIATPSTGYRFNIWSITSGTATIATPLSYSTTVALTSKRATVQANFSAGTIYPITSSDVSYNYTTNYYSGADPSGGVAFSFTAPANGSYSIAASDVSATSLKYLYYYGTSSSFGSYLGSQNGTGTLNYALTATAGTTYYFKVAPSGSSFWPNNFTIKYTTAPTLTVTSGGNGTTSPSGSLAVSSGVAQAIQATPNTGYRFNNWTVTSGSATIANASLYSTSATITGNATIQANFSAGAIYPITPSDVPYNFTTNYYTGVDPSWGVACSFTPSSTGSYSIVTSDRTSSSSKYLYYYGTSNTFSSSLGSQYGSGTVTYTFAATAGVTYYFRVYPNGSSYWPNDFNIKWVTAPTLTMAVSGNGTTTPAVGTTVVTSGVAQSITATPTLGNLFVNWTVTSGSAIIGTSISYNTTATLTANATVQANFISGTIHQITATDSTYNFTTHCYSGLDASWGVACSFTPTTTGNYSIVTSDPTAYSYKYLYNYGTSSSFSSTVGYQYGTGTVAYTFSASAGTTYYFRVYPSGSSYWPNDFKIKWTTAPTLTMAISGSGTTSPAVGSSAVTAGIAQNIAGYPNTGYRFNNWTVTSGSATIANATYYSTTATLNADATVQANFIPGIIYALTPFDSTYNFTTHYYSGYDPTGGVAFSFSAPSAGSFAVTVADVGTTSYKYIYYYGTSSTFGSYLSYQYGTGTVTYIFSAPSAGTYYFAVAPYTSSYWTNNFSVRCTTAPTLTVNNDGHGTTSPTGATAVAAGVAQSISATPAMGYRFNNWSVTSGSATIANTSLYTTTATITANATIQANFANGTIYPITASYSKNTYQTDYFTGVDPTWGVAFQFTPATNGAYAIVISDSLVASYKYLYFYGTNSAFTTTSPPYQYGTGALTYLFTGSAGSTYYFRIAPNGSSYWPNSFFIRFTSTPMLTVTNDGYGSTTPAGDIAVVPGAATSINATPKSSVYYFNRWEIIAGTPTIGSLTSASTTVTLGSSDAAIRADFSSYTHDTLIVQSGGKGYTFPVDTAYILKNIDTSVSATPFGGWQFSSWSTVSGTVTIATPSSSKSRVSFPSGAAGGKAVIRANFTINPSSKPKIAINNIDLSAHPNICLTASVTDSATGRNIAGLDSSMFALSQDAAALGFQLNAITRVRGVSVSLVLDVSGSMASTQIDYVKQSAKNYVQSMSPYDRCAIVAFGSAVHLEQSMTSDTALLNAAINRVSDGGGTALYDGTNTGIAQLLSETNSKAVILYSDGGENASVITQDSVIHFSQHTSAPLYTIGIGSGDTVLLKKLADSTGGYFSYGPDASALAQIYGQIKRDIEAQYILCYRSPDTVFNGDTHTVVASVTFNSKTARDTIKWNESNQPPVITLTPATAALIGVNQPVGAAITIGAIVTDDGSVSSVKLFYRHSSSNPGSYTQVPMVLSSPNTYQAIIPGGQVSTPGIDFYIIAFDNFNFVGRSPNILTPEKQPWVIPVGTDAPSIVYTPPACGYSGSAININATVTDADGLLNVVLFYKKATDFFFSTDTMRVVSGSQYQGTIAGSAVTNAGVEFYFFATDRRGVASRAPQSGTEIIYLCGNINRPPIANAGPDQTVKIGTGCQTSVILNGSGSSDPEGNPISYSWQGPFGTNTSGATPTVILPVGRNQIVLTVTDDKGATGKDTVVVTVSDTAAPIPSIPSLPQIVGSCSVTLSRPNATDNCTGAITGSTVDPLTYSTPGTFTVHWTYTDASGNVATQIQSVVVNDAIAPVPSIANLPDVHGVCSVTLSRPTAIDNCAGTLSGTTTDPLTYSAQGIYIVHWTYTDGNNNSATQNQTVVIKDTVAPVIVKGADTAVIVSTSDSLAIVKIRAATAIDSCTSATITGARDDGRPLDSAYRIGVTAIRWKACDANANCDSVIQKVSVLRNRPPQLFAVADTTIKEKDSLRLIITASDSDGTAPKISAASPLPAGCNVTDNGGGKATLSWTPGCNDHGVYSVKLKAFDGTDSVLMLTTIRVTDVNFPPAFVKTADQYAQQLKPFSLTIKAEDCDGPPKLRAINLPAGSQFTDNGDGTGTMLWTPKDNEAGYYMVIFEAGDGSTTVRDTVIVIVRDASMFTPTLTVSTRDTTVGINLPIVVLAQSKVQDGTIPVLSTTALPPGAQFVGDGAGNGVFTWTPKTVGTVTFTITACNVTDTSLKTNVPIKISVDNRNVTGPVFLRHADTAIDQNMQLALTVEARDLDGAIPELYLVSAPPEVRFVDNNNGTGTFFWTPKCDVSGHFTLRAGATDHFLADSISVGVDVRIVNSPPLIAPIPDKSAAPGEMVRIAVSASDPCIGGSIPMLSVSCDLPGYTFKTNGDGTGVFGWLVSYDSGSYPITFYATNGFATAGKTMILSINKTGSIIITARKSFSAGKPGPNRIYAFPSMNYSGTFIGNDSVVFKSKPGVYWFEANADGCRSVRAAFEIKADSVSSRSMVLKPSIPLMFTRPDSGIVDTAVSSSQAGAFTFADLNGDGILDLSVLSGNSIVPCFGFNKGTDSGFAAMTMDSALLRSPISGCVGHVYCDWNNTGSLSGIVSNRFGNILLLSLRKGRYEIAETLCTVAGSKPYPLVADINHDGKKDLVVHSEGRGLFVYENIGSDSLPRFGAPREIKDSLRASLLQLKGPPLLLNLNPTGATSWIFSSAGVLKMFTVNSACSTMTYEGDVNCAGARCLTDSIRYGIIGSPSGQPKLVIVKGRAIKTYSTHLCGDVNGDGTVDIRDISKIAKLWERTEQDSAWDPLFNLKLGNGGAEVINIQDVSKATKCWELKE